MSYSLGHWLQRNRAMKHGNGPFDPAGPCCREHCWSNSADQPASLKNMDRWHWTNCHSYLILRFCRWDAPLRCGRQRSRALGPGDYQLGLSGVKLVSHEGLENVNSWIWLISFILVNRVQTIVCTMGSDSLLATMRFSKIFRFLLLLKPQNPGQNLTDFIIFDVSIKQFINLP